ncbi:hypothetical protein [Peribacillus butanolivorans]|uniref:hypothetical protein n=1 Tax=Peribacillus butanolivorans TaxID=421767 RepID=UPI00367267F1
MSAFTHEFSAVTREFGAFTREFGTFTREFGAFTRELSAFTHGFVLSLEFSPFTSKFGERRSRKEGRRLSNPYIVRNL